MSCNCSSQPIVAAIDQRFESEANGDPAIHWLGAATFPVLGGARSVSHYVAILGLDGPSTGVELVAQGSIDGKSWGNIEGLSSPTPYTAPTTEPLQIKMVPSEVTPLPPLVRYGVRVSATAALGAARLTWLLTPDDDAGTEAVLDAGASVNPGASAVLLDWIDVRGAPMIVLSASCSVAATIDLETAVDTTMPHRVTQLVLTGAAPSDSMTVATEAVLRYVRVVNRNAVVGTVNWALMARRR